MLRFFILFILFFVTACNGQSREELVQEGNRLLKEGNYRGAIVLYKNALEKDVNDIAARRGLAEANLKSGNLDRAEKEFQKVLLQNPSESTLLLKLAEIYIAQGQAEKALLELDKFHSENQETVESLVLNGRAHALSGDLFSAENLFNQALILDPQALPPRINLAKVHLQKKELDKAKQYLQDVISIDRSEEQAYYLLANIEMRQGRRVDALRIYQDLVQIAPQQIQAFYMSGIIQMDLGDFDAAESTVLKLQTNFPDRAEGPRLKGILLYRQGQYDEARIVLENSLKTEQHLLAYFFLGLSYYGLNQFELALNQFQKAIDLYPDFERARTLVAMTLLKQKRVDDAIIEIQKVLRINPSNAYAHNILGSAYLASGQYEKGLEELELATELDPSLADAHLKRGVFRLAQSEGAQGEADLIKAVEAAPEVMNNRLMLATYYLRQKNYTAAIQLLQEGKDGTKADALLDNYLAAAYFSQKKPVAALAALEEAKQINPDYLTPYFNLASYYASRSEFAKAMGEYQQIIVRDDKNLRALLGMAALYSVQGQEAELERTYRSIEGTQLEDGFISAAQYYLKKKNLDAALAVVGRGLDVYSSSAPLLEIKGSLLAAKQQPSEAEVVFTQLAGIAPEQGYNLLVRLYLATGVPVKARELVDGLLRSAADRDYPYLLASSLSMTRQDPDAAVESLKQGIATVRNPIRLQVQLGRIYEQSNKTDLAEQVYRQIVAASPKFAPAYTSLGLINERRGNKGEALDLYRKALTYDKNSIPALNNLAYLLAENFGEANEALVYAMNAYRLQPNDPRIMDTLGYVLVRNDRADDALNLLLKASELLPDVPAVKLHLAMARIKAGDKAAARALLTEIADGDGPEAGEARKLLKSF